jgi:hypothetical protein
MSETQINIEQGGGMVVTLQPSSLIEPADMPIWGIKDIAALINRTKPQTYRLASAGKIPVVKVGGEWMTTLRRLRAFLEPEGEAAGGEA